MSREKVFGMPRNLRMNTPEDELQLLAEYRAGDNSAKAKLIEGKLYFIVKIAARYRGHRYTNDDIMQDAIEGALIAIDKWDPERGNLAYCMFLHIKANIITRISCAENLLAMSKRYLNYRSTIRKEMEKDEPDLDRLSHVCGQSAGLVSSLAYGMQDWTSIESITTRSGNSFDTFSLFRDHRVKFVDDLMDGMAREKIIDAVDTLPANKRYIIKSLFGIGCTRKTGEQIAAEMKMTRQAIYQHKDAAIKKLRKFVALEELAHA